MTEVHQPAEALATESPPIPPSAPAPVRPPSRRRQLVGRVAVLLLALAVLPPLAELGGGSYVGYAYTLGTAFAISVLGNNLIVGYLGEANLAGGAFLALGAYIGGIGFAHGVGVLPAAAIAIVAGAVVGVLLAVPAARVRGHQLALATLGLAWATPDLINYAESWTGGTQGLTLSPAATIAGVPPGGGGIVEGYVISAVFVVCALVALMALYGRFGRLLVTHSEAGPAAKSFGVRTWTIAALAWGGCGALGALSGVFYGHAVGFLSPDEFNFQVSLFLFVGSMVGGARSVPGAWVGGLLAGALPQLLSNVPGGASILVFGVFGAVLALVVIFARRGVYPSVERVLLRGYRRRRSGGAHGG
jgi:branched-chain amino acid transport system permease protein